MIKSPLTAAAFVVLPMMAQVSTCDPGAMFSGIFDPDVVLTGRGSMQAEGVGTATLRGSGSIQVNALDRTGLVILDAANVQYELEGEGQTYWYQGHLIVDGMLGSASIEGEELRVGLHGGPMELFAEGVGRVTLQGEGTYSTGGGPAVRWDVEEHAVDYGETQGRSADLNLDPDDRETLRDYGDLIRRVREQLANPDAVITGTGVLDAYGTGSASVIGDGTIDIETTGHAGLIIFDADQAVFELAGEGRTQWRGHNLIAEGYLGTAHVQGEALRVVVTGGPMTLHTEGTGQVRLSGTGYYETQSGKSGDIEEAPNDVSF